MSGPLVLLLALAFGYLLGSIPFGLIFTRFAGTEDLRSIGSGNIGATNVLRTGRKGLAAATLVCDALKGTRMAVIKRLADRFMTEENWKIVDALQAFCDARGRSLLEVAFSWLLSRPVLSSVIAGATKPEQVEANANAASWKLSAEDLAEINKITKK